MDEIEYVFGTGDGLVHVWTSQADLELAGTGAADAVRIDFDGDGLADDALWDSSGGGVADIAALDLDDDGVLDHFFTDPTGLGTWDHQITGSPADAESEPLGWIVRTEVDELWDAPLENSWEADTYTDRTMPCHPSAALPEHIAHRPIREGRGLGGEPFIG